MRVEYNEVTGLYHAISDSMVGISGDRLVAISIVLGLYAK